MKWLVCEDNSWPHSTFDFPADCLLFEKDFTLDFSTLSGIYF